MSRWPPRCWQTLYPLVGGCDPALPALGEEPGLLWWSGSARASRIISGASTVLFFVDGLRLDMGYRLQHLLEKATLQAS